MNLVDLLKESGGKQSLRKLSGELGLGKSQTKDLVGALAPALLRSMQKQTQSSDNLAGLKNALATGDHQKYLRNPELLKTDDAREDGNRILGHLFGSKDVSRNVAAQASQTTGIDTSLIKKALPLVAGLVMGTMSKKSNAGRDIDQSSGDLLGQLMGGALAGGGDGFGIDDVLGIARKFF